MSDLHGFVQPGFLGPGQQVSDLSSRGRTRCQPLIDVLLQAGGQGAVMGAVQPGKKLDRLGDLLFGVSRGRQRSFVREPMPCVTDAGDATWRIVPPGARTAGSVTAASFAESQRSNRASGSSRAAKMPACSSRLRRWLVALSVPASSRP